MAIGKSGSQYGIFEFRVEFNFSKTKKTLHLALDTRSFSPPTNTSSPRRTMDSQIKLAMIDEQIFLFFFVFFFRMGVNLTKSLEKLLCFAYGRDRVEA